MNTQTVKRVPLLFSASLPRSITADSAPSPVDVLIKPNVRNVFKTFPEKPYRVEPRRVNYGLTTPEPRPRGSPSPTWSVGGHPAEHL